MKAMLARFRVMNMLLIRIFPFMKMRMNTVNKSYMKKNKENFDRQYGRSEKKGYELDKK